MKYGGLLSDLFRMPDGPRYSLAFLLAAFLFSSFPTLAQSTDRNRQKEVRALIKQAARSTRNESLDEAEALLRRAVELDPERTDAQVELAYVLVKKRRLVDAYNLCVPIAEKEPKNARALAVVGATLLSAGRFKEANLVLINAIKKNRREDLAWAGLGMLDFYENRIDDSFYDLVRANEYKPNEPDYLFALAQVAGRAEKFTFSAEKYEEFLSVSNKNDLDRRARIKGLIRFLRVLGQTGPLYETHGSDRSSVRFDLVGDRPIIKLSVNNSEPLKFVLDTGSGISVLSETTAKRLKINPVTKGGYARGIGGTGKFEIVYGLLREVEIGDVNIKNVPVFLRRFHDTGKDVDGYIGLALLSKFLTTIDYGSHTFSLTKKEADSTAFRRDQLKSLPLRLTSSGFLSGEVQVEGVEAPLNFIVDTGASVSVISERVAKTDSVSMFLNDQKMQVIGSAGVRDDVPTFLLPRVTFGSNTQKSIMAVALDLDVINETSGFEQAGILGGNFLKNYRLTFDFKNSKVVFESVTPDN